MSRLVVARLSRVVLARRPFARLAVLSSTGVTAAYALGSALPHVNAQVAAITALVAARPTFHASVQEGLRQTLGLLLGAAFALLIITTVGIGVPALLVGMLGCWVAARLLRLGEEGAGTLAITVILVLGPTFKPDAIESRFLAVGVGSLVAMVISYFIRPGQPHERALDAALTQAQRSAALLTVIANHLAYHSGHVDRATAHRWLDRANKITAELAAVRTLADDAVVGAHWSPMIDREDAEAVAAQARLTHATAVVVANICRDLLAANHGPMPTPLAASLSDVFAAAADAIVDQSKGARAHPAETLGRDDQPVQVLTSTRRVAVHEIRNLEDIEPMLLGGALLADAETLAELLTALPDRRGG
jgi:Fusaric acid resistance protein-like